MDHLCNKCRCFFVLDNFMMFVYPHIKTHKGRVKLNMENNFTESEANIDNKARIDTLWKRALVCGILCVLSVLTLIVDIVITAMGLLSTIGGVLSIGIPIVAIIFFFWLTSISLQSHDELYIKTYPPKVIKVLNSKARYKEPPYQTYEYDSIRS